MLGSPEAVQMKGAGAEAGTGEKKRPGEGVGAGRGEAGAERGGVEAGTELTENTDLFV